MEEKTLSLLFPQMRRICAGNQRRMKPISKQTPNQHSLRALELSLKLTFGISVKHSDQGTTRDVFVPYHGAWIEF